jgi:hypothetical protein
MRPRWSLVKWVISSTLSPFKTFLGYKRRILAVAVFLAIVSSFLVASYLDHREIWIDEDPDQLNLKATNAPMSSNTPKFYKVALESIDNVGGTVHLRANLQIWPKDTGVPFLIYAEEFRETSRTYANAIPIQMLFGPFEISDASDEFFGNPIQYFQWHPIQSGISSNPPPNYSESVPGPVEADVQLFGDSWLYPFDQYLVAARVKCPVLATSDRKQYFIIPSQCCPIIS